ncbi:Uncharacterised protein [Vibrio cholerae]|nr:Uncharacterised protein [Vibrio cholerae]
MAITSPSVSVWQSFIQVMKLLCKATGLIIPITRESVSAEGIPA